MKKVNYIICYRSTPIECDGRKSVIKYIIREIEITEKLGADEMYELCQRLLSGICKTRFSIVAALCSGEYVDFCFLGSGSFCPTNCLTCTFKKHFKGILSEHVAKSGKSNGQYIQYIYRGGFMKNGVPEKRYLNLKFIKQKPLVLNKALCETFKEEFEKANKEHGWELIDLSLVDEKPTGCYSDPSVFHPDEHHEVVWVRVQDNSQVKGESYIPGYKQNGKIWSVLGELINPDNEDDMLPFTQCPIEGYIVVRKPI